MHSCDSETGGTRCMSVGMYQKDRRFWMQNCGNET